MLFAPLLLLLLLLAPCTIDPITHTNGGNIELQNVRPNRRCLAGPAGEQQRHAGCLPGVWHSQVEGGAATRYPQEVANPPAR